MSLYKKMIDEAVGATKSGTDTGAPRSRDQFVFCCLAFTFATIDEVG